MNGDFFLITVGDISQKIKTTDFKFEGNQVGFNGNRTHFHFGNSNLEFFKENVSIFSKKALIYFSSDSIELLNFILFQASPLSEIYINKKCNLNKFDFDFYNTIHYKNLKVFSF